MDRLILDFANAAVRIPVPYLENGRTQIGWDCWGLVVSAFNTIGIDLSPYEEVATKDLKQAYTRLKEQIQQWVQVEAGKEKPWDVIHIRPAHLAIVVKKGFMLHVMEGVNTCIVPYNHYNWIRQIEGFYRHAGLSGR